MNKNKKIYFGILLLTVILVTSVYFSYGFFTNKIEEHGKLNLVVGSLDYQIESKYLKNNKITVPAGQVKEFVVKVTSLNEIESKYELYYLLEKPNQSVEVGYSTDTRDKPSDTIAIKGKKEITVTIHNKSQEDALVEFKIIGGFVKNELKLVEGNKIPQYQEIKYVENLLNGTDPVLKENLVPVMIEEDGTVRKAGIEEEWYDYETKRWANVIILKNEKENYLKGEIIPESAIESYFVWIPKYSYQLWDLGNYSSITSIDSSKVHEISIKFGTTNTNDNVNGECTTPMNNEKTQGLVGSSGNCKEGDYMTHPAFISFNANGLWVGKFETGYEGATKTGDAQVNSAVSDKIIIKPDVYSWRSITVGNAFQASYKYKEDLKSHMMKNTEWGAVAYLQHSIYGSQQSVRINNNSSYITGYAATEEPTKGYNNGVDTEGNHVSGTVPGKDGQYTVSYFSENQTTNQLASTTGNKTGVYDMSGGAWEYVMGYTTEGGTNDKSEFTPSLYNSKYYDTYSASQYTNYNQRILGDATGEMGPFGSEKDPSNATRYISSWYKDCTNFVSSFNPWFYRGGAWSDGSVVGVFAFNNNGTNAGGVASYISFRVVLAPNN